MCPYTGVCVCISPLILLCLPILPVQATASGKVQRVIKLADDLEKVNGRVFLQKTCTI